MRFFLQTAAPDEAREASALGLIDGVTTSTALIAASGRDPETTVRDLCAIVTGPVACEVAGTASGDMVAEGRTMSAWADNVVVTVPMGRQGLRALTILRSEGIPTAVTLIVSAPQALLAAAAGATHVIPLVGLGTATEHHDMEMVTDVCGIFATHGLSCEVIVPGLCTHDHVLGAARAGADAIVLSTDLLFGLLDHPERE